MNPEQLQRLGKTANFGMPFVVGRQHGRTLAQEILAQQYFEQFEAYLEMRLLSYPTRFERILDLVIQ